MEKGCIPVKLADPLPFHKVLLIEYPYTYDDLSILFQIVCLDTVPNSVSGE